MTTAQLMSMLAAAGMAMAAATLLRGLPVYDTRACGCCAARWQARAPEGAGAT